jgi:hypothetical protein
MNRRRRRRGEGGDSRAQDVGLRVLRRHHPVRRLGVDDGRRGRDRAAGLLDARPQAAQRPDLGHAEELVLIDGDGEADMRRGIDQRLARFLEHAQVRDGGRQHGAEFLRLGGAGIVVDAAVGLEQHARHAEREEMRQRLRHRGLQRLDRHAQPAGAGEDGRRIDAEGEAELASASTRRDVSVRHSQSTPAGFADARRRRWTLPSGSRRGRAFSASCVAGRP